MDNTIIVKSAQIMVTYETNTNRGSNDFNNLQKLKRWLDKHALIADKLGYVKKTKSSK